MEHFWIGIITDQFLASLKMMENAIRACPPDVWAAPGKPIAWSDTEPVGFWYLAFHTLFFVDVYLSESEEAFFPPPPFTRAELDPSGILPDRVYAPSELLNYLDHCRTKLLAYAAALTEETAKAPCGFPGRRLSNAELLIYNTRHVQHHTAQLHLLMRQAGLVPPRWVGTGRK